MVDIALHQVYKRFAYQWILKDVSKNIPAGDKLAVVGPNGSGKSTLLKIILGTIDPSKGSIEYVRDGKKLTTATIYKYFSFAAPYMTLMESFSTWEILNFHFRLKKPVQNLSLDEILEIIQLQPHKDKRINYFSSGMKQRLKLGIAILSDCPILVLDEPTTNLDEQGKMWFQDTLEKYLDNRTLIIASNDEFDLNLTTSRLDVNPFNS